MTTAGHFQVFVCLVMIVATCAPAHAQELTSGTQKFAVGPVQMLEELEIVSSDEASSRTGDVVMDEHTGSRSQITRSRLQQPGAQLGRLLGGTNGIQHKQFGGFGTFSSVTVRAASAAQTAVYLDGILLNSGGDSIIDLSTLDVLNLDSVDVFRGSSPLQLGHASMGGAVNLNTLTNNVDHNTRIRLGLSSYSHASILALHQGKSDNWDWLGSVNHQQSDNDFGFVNINGTPQNPDDDESQRRLNNAIQLSSLLFKTGYQSSETKRTDFLAQITQKESGVPNARNSLNYEATSDSVKTQLQVAQTLDELFGWNTKHSLYFHQSDSLYDDSRRPTEQRPQFIETDVHTLGLKAYWERFVEAGTFGLSTDIRHEALDFTDKLNTEDNFTANRQLVLSTMHLAMLDDNERFMITPALRWQYSQREGSSASQELTQDILSANESEVGTQLGASYFYSPQITFNANAGNYFREPTFSELYSSIGLVNNNPRLNAESGINLDIGIVYKGDKFLFEATIFRSLRDELILTTFNSRGIGSAQNVGKATVTGLELSADWKPSALWTLSANATIQDPRNRYSFGSYINNLLPGEATRTAFTRIQYQPSQLAYWHEWQVTRERFYDSANLLPAADTSLHSIGIDFKKNAWEVGARLNNIGNDTVEDFNGFPTPGRHLSLAITHSR